MTTTTIAQINLALMQFLLRLAIFSSWRCKIFQVYQESCLVPSLSYRAKKNIWMSRDSNPDDQAALANGPSIIPWPNEQPISIKLANDQNLTHPIHPIKLIILSILSNPIQEHLDTDAGPGDPEDRQPLRREVRHLHGPELPQHPGVVLRHERRHQRCGHHEGEQQRSLQFSSFSFSSLMRI